MRRRAVLAVLAAAVAAGCGNAGEGRLLTIGEPGVVKGIVYFDVNGDKIAGAGDDTVKNATIRLITLSGRDTIASGVTLVSGQFRISPVPVGTYRVALDAGILADTAVLEVQDSAQVTILPNDSSFVVMGLSYPHVSIRTARTPALVPLGRKVFIEGIVLNGQNTFADNTMHFQDTSAAIRASRVFTTGAAPGDTVRVRGTVVADTNGLRKLDIVTVTIINQSFVPAPTIANAVQAQGAFNGTRDAQLLRLPSVTLSDTTAAAGVILHVNDTSSVDVVIDQAVSGRVNHAQLVKGNKFDITGLAVPSGTPGVWVLKPRSQADLVPLP